MTPTELEALAALTGIPYAYHQGQGFVQTAGSGLDDFKLCEGCFFTDTTGSPNTPNCTRFRNKENTRVFGVVIPGMCDRALTHVPDPVWRLVDDSD